MGVLDRISIKGFKSIRSAELDIRPINVLIGANGSGKSNLLEAMAFLQAIRAGNLQGYVGRAGGADRLLHFGAKTTDEMAFRARFSNEGICEYRLALTPTDTGALYPNSEALVFWDKEIYPDEPRKNVISGEGGEAGVSKASAGRESLAGKYVLKGIDSWRVYHFHDTGPASPMKKTVALNDNRYLRPDGSNLAAFLYLLREKHEWEYGFIRRTVQKAAPFLEDFVLDPQDLNKDTIRLKWKHIGDDACFDVSALSDGTLRFLALATLMLQPKERRPSVILLDEPELGMHPAEITLFEAMVGYVSKDAGGVQVILATQSARLLDQFEIEDVVVADRVKGATEFSRLDAEKLEVWLERYSLGELWEMNDIGGRPTGTWREALR